MPGNQGTRYERARPQDIEDQDDEALVRQVGHTREAFAELYRRYVHGMYRFHLVRTGNTQDAQDLTSQTFLAALEGIAGFRGRGSFRGWLFGIARHKAADHYRRRRPEAALESVQELDDGAPLPEEAAAVQLQLAQVSTALCLLSPEQGEALVLRIFGELSAAQVAEIMGKSEVAVRMLVYRGLRRLRKKLARTQEVPQ